MTFKHTIWKWFYEELYIPFSVRFLWTHCIKILYQFFSIFRLCGVAADGPYQASNFKSTLRDLLGLKEQDELQFPVTWDPGHLLNLAVLDVRDSKTTPTGQFLSTFIRRSNLFNQTLARGKGFAFLNMLDEKSLTPVTYATQR